VCLSTQPFIPRFGKMRISFGRKGKSWHGSFRTWMNASVAAKTVKSFDNACRNTVTATTVLEFFRVRLYLSMGGTDEGRWRAEESCN